MTDMWPGDIEAVEMKAPVTILKQQAALLGPKTKNLVQASVATENSSFTIISNKPVTLGGQFKFSFHIGAKALQYSYRLFSISHGLDLYPVRFYLDEDLLPDVGGGTDPKVEAKSEAELLVILKQIFAAKKTRKIIGALLAQVGNSPS